MTTRREFIRIGAVTGAALLTGTSAADSIASPVKKEDLYTLSAALVEQWGKSLLRLQVLDSTRVNDYGGIWCPADKAVHGRVGDSIYPFFYLAARTRDHQYIDASVLLYKWMESRVSQPDGSWLNEPVKGSWKGTTVFAAIALAEAVKNYGGLMDTTFKNQVTARLKKAGDYIFNNFTLDYGNINYPVSAAYGLYLLGDLLDVPQFKTRGGQLAHEGLQLVTRHDKLLTGEGGPLNKPSKKGCLSVDLGYNVEESLQALVMYGKLSGNHEVLETVNQMLAAHLEFMLPDGAWDNSWGTRNFKWTYWGSRTSDGCQTAYALMADNDARYYKAAIRNTQLMQRCTYNGLLTGGPHYASHGVTPCVHHTFSHIKALTNVLVYGNRKLVSDIDTVKLPREEAYNSRFFPDIQTALIAKGPFRATITAYDREYKDDKNGHATGGALTMLWHPKTGAILAGSMNQYQLFEAGNMQHDNDPHSISLTPRFDIKTNDKVYTNISDLNAVMESNNEDHQVTVTTRSKLVDKDQHDPPTGEIRCEVSYTFKNDAVILRFSHNGLVENIRIIIPVIARSNEQVKVVGANRVHIYRSAALLSVSANHPIGQLPSTNGRVFNFVPGFEAVPFFIEQNNVVVNIRVSSAAISRLGVVSRFQAIPGH